MHILVEICIVDMSCTIGWWYTAGGKIGVAAYSCRKEPVQDFCTKLVGGGGGFVGGGWVGECSLQS